MPSPRPDDIAKQWADAMMVYNINPIYPPTQDVQVGDIYAYRTDQTEQYGNLFRAIKLDYVPMLTELESHYGARPVFPETSAAPAAGEIWREPCSGTGCAATPKAGDSQAKPASSATPTGAGKKTASGNGTLGRAAGDNAAPVSIFKPAGTLTQLPLVAFPELQLAHVDVESLGASVPARFFQAIFGASRRAEGALKIQIKAGQTFGVPAVPAAIALGKYCQVGIGRYSCSSEFIRKQLMQFGSVTDQTPIAVSMVNRLFLVRSIEYTVDSNTAMGAQSDLYVSLPKALENQQRLLDELAGKVSSASKDSASAGVTTTAQPNAAQSGKSPDNEAQQAADSTATKFTDVKAALDTLLKTVQATNQQFSGAPLPGMSFAVGRVDARGISLIQTFDRPVAIGYRAVVVGANESEAKK